jgi:hypothetical protein
MSFDGILYQCQSITQWFGIDGWVEVHMINIGPDLNERIIFGFSSLVNDSGNSNFDNGNFDN